MERNIKNNPNGKPFCCKIGCYNDSIVNIKYGDKSDDNTQSCAYHIPDLSGVYGFETAPIELPSDTN